MERTNRSAWAFRFGLRGGSFTVSTFEDSRISRNDRVDSGSRSWMRYRDCFRNPSSQSVRVRAICLIHSPLSRGRIPAISTLPVLRSITKSTKYRTKPVRVSTSTLKKSVAAILGNGVSSHRLSLLERLPRHSLPRDRIKSVLVVVVVWLSFGALRGHVDDSFE